MKRTIEMKGMYVYYRGKCLDWVLSTVTEHFELGEEGKYIVTIVEGNQYQIINDPGQIVDNPDDIELYAIIVEGDIELYAIIVEGGTGYERIFVCRKHFDKLFFKPDFDKRYDITVKEVRI